MKKLLLFLALATCLLISIGAKETVIYENDFSSSDLSDFTMYGNMTVKDGALKAVKTSSTKGPSAYVAYTFPEKYQGKDYIIEYDVLRHTSLVGIMIGANSNKFTTAPYFCGFSFSTTESGEKVYYGAFDDSEDGWGDGFSTSRAFLADLPSFHMSVKVYKGSMTASIYKLGSDTPIYVSRYEIGEANRNDDSSRNPDPYVSFSSTVGIRQYYKDEGSVDNLKITVIEDDVLPKMTAEVTVNGKKFLSGGISANSTVASGNGAMLSTDSLTGDYRVEFDLAAKNVSRLLFGMKDEKNGYAFEINEKESTLILYKIKNGYYEILAEEDDIVRTDYIRVALDVCGGIASLYYNNLYQEESEFPKYEFYLDGTDGKFGMWLEGGKVKGLTVGDSEAFLPDETYMNPINPGADPDVLYYNGTYYLYVYAGVSSNEIFRVYTSPDLVHFTKRNIVFTWHDEYSKTAIRNSSWSPNVSYNEQDGLFYLFFAAKRVEEGGVNIRSVYYATSTSPYGPFEFKDENGNYAPLEPVNPIDEQPVLDIDGNRVYNEDGTLAYGKSNEIDGHPFYDDNGKIYMSFSRYDMGGTIWVAEVEMKNGRVTPVRDENGEIVQSRAITPTDKWDVDGATHLAEGGYIWKHEGLYYMVYATTSYARHYGEAYAVAEHPLGPYVKCEQGKFLTHNFELDGPGDALIVRSPDQTELYLIYHRHYSTSKVHLRQTCTDRLIFVDDPDDPSGPDLITTAGPTSTPQKLPSNKYRYDVSRDGQVTLFDLLLAVQNCTNKVEKYCGYYDVNADGIVSFRDVYMVAAEALK